MTPGVRSPNREALTAVIGDGAAVSAEASAGVEARLEGAVGGFEQPNAALKITQRISDGTARVLIVFSSTPRGQSCRPPAYGESGCPGLQRLTLNGRGRHGNPPRN